MQRVGGVVVWRVGGVGRAVCRSIGCFVVKLPTSESHGTCSQRRYGAAAAGKGKKGSEKSDQRPVSDKCALLADGPPRGEHERKLWKYLRHIYNRTPIVQSGVDGYEVRVLSLSGTPHLIAKGESVAAALQSGLDDALRQCGEVPFTTNGLRLHKKLDWMEKQSKLAEESRLQEKEKEAAKAPDEPEKPAEAAHKDAENEESKVEGGNDFEHAGGEAALDTTPDPGVADTTTEAATATISNNEYTIKFTNHKYPKPEHFSLNEGESYEDYTLRKARSSLNDFELGDMIARYEQENWKEKAVEVGDMMERTVNKLLPSPQAQIYRKNLIAHLRNVTQEKKDKDAPNWAHIPHPSSGESGPILYPLGSHVIGTARGDSDLDVCIVLDRDNNSSFTRDDTIRILHGYKWMFLRRKTGFFNWVVDKVHVIPARVPILLLNVTHPMQGCIASVDISLSPIGVRNSAYLRQYVEQDPSIVLPLTHTVLRWSKQCGINAPKHGYMSSYTMLILILHYLIQRGKIKHIPITQIPTPQPPANEFWSAARPIRLTSELKEDLARELLGFFHYFAFSRWRKVFGVRPQCGFEIPIEMKVKDGWNEMFTLGVEDPLEIHRNLTANIEPGKLDTIRTEFMRAFQLMQDGEFIVEDH